MFNEKSQELKKALQENTEDLESLLEENSHLRELLEKYGPGFIEKENEALRELTKNVLQLRYLDKEGPHINKTTKKMLEEKVAEQFEK